MKIINLNASVTASNDDDAEALRQKLNSNGQLLVNIMSSAGSGKTTLISKIITDLKDTKIAVMEADIESSVDAEKIEALGAKAIQVHTNGMCHMDAGMTAQALLSLNSNDSKLIFLENVGNLICPCEYDTGAQLNVMILSVSEGDDKPLKYPLMFQKSDALVISKTDTMSFFNFNLELCSKRAKALNPGLKIFPVSAKTGDGMEALENFLKTSLIS